MRRSTVLFPGLAAMLLLASCSSDTPQSAPEPASSGEASAANSSEEELLALLPDRTTADCVGSLEFVGERRVEGHSHCSGNFSGSTDGSLATGTSCAYSTRVQTQTATEFTAAGHFVCSEGSHGTFIFKEQKGKAEGVATATTADGRVVTIAYR